MAAQEEQFPTCAHPALYPTITNEYCPGCFRIVWRKEVLRQEREHQQLHELRLCECELIFDDKERAERIERLKMRGKGRPKEKGKGKAKLTATDSSTSHNNRETLCGIMRRDTEEKNHSKSTHSCEEFGCKSPSQCTTQNSPFRALNRVLSQDNKTAMTFCPGDGPYKTIDFENDRSGWAQSAIIDPAIGNYPTLERPKIKHQYQQHTAADACPVTKPQRPADPQQLAAAASIVTENNIYCKVAAKTCVEQPLIDPTEADLSGIYKNPMVVSSDMYYRVRRGSAPG
jgi:hypothetical protein